MTANETAVLVIEGDMLRGIVGELRATGEVVRRKSASWSMVDGSVSGDGNPSENIMPSPVKAVDDSASAAANGDSQALTFGANDPASIQLEVSSDDTPRVRAFRAAREELGVPRVILGIPMSRLIVQVLRLPVDVRENLASVVSLQLEKKSPCTADEMTVGYEILSEFEDSLIVLAAGFPNSEADDIIADAELAGLEITRVDIPLLGWFRTMYASSNLMAQGRKAVLSKMNADWNIQVLQDGIPCFARTIGSISPTALPREIYLSILEAEEIYSKDEVGEIILFSPSDHTPAESVAGEIAERLKTFLDVPVRGVVSSDCYLSCDGLLIRAFEKMTLDLTPEAWKQARYARVVGNRVKMISITVSSIAVAALAVLLAAPLVFGMLADRQRKISTSHYVAYKKVSNTREKVKLIESYTDRSSSALEMLKIVSESITPGITLTSFSYRRQDSVKISAEADTSAEVYSFKDKLSEKTVFGTVNLSGPSSTRNGKFRFEINAFFKNSEDDKKK